MEKYIKSFQSYGNDILTSPLAIYNGTAPTICSSEIFINVCKHAIQNNSEKEVITGILFYFGPCVSNDLNEKNENGFWEVLLELSRFITENSMIYGYLEAVTELSIKSKKINDEYLSFLINPEMEVQYKYLKPLVLVCLFDCLPDLFIFKNTEYFLPLVLDTFQAEFLGEEQKENEYFLYRSNLLLILSKMNINMDVITSIPIFSNLIWTFIYETSLSDINFPVLSNPLGKLRELVPDFFEMPNDIISEKLQSNEVENVIGLVRLLPYLNFDYFLAVFQMLFDFISSNAHVSRKLNDAVFDSLCNDFSDQAIEHMYSILSKSILKNCDDVSIYIFTLYFKLFEELRKDSGLFLIKSINLAFSTLESNKSILCFAVFQIAEQYKTRSRLLSNSVIPSLIKSFTINNDECSKYASKAFRKLYQTQTIQPSVYLNEYLELFDELKKIPDYSPYSMHKYFKVLYTIVSLKDEEDNDDDMQDIFDESIILEFAKRNIFDAELQLGIKTFILELCTSLIKSFPCKFSPLNDEASSLAVGLLKSNIYFSYPVAAEFILFSNDFKLEGIYDRLIEISKGAITAETIDDKIIRITSYYTAVIASQNESCKYPVEIIQEQLKSKDSFYQSRAIMNLQFVYSKYDDETLAELIAYIIQLSKVSQSSSVVDSTFVLLKKLMKQKPDFSFQFASDLILATIQGRIALLDHNFPYNYDHRKFKFYKCLSSYIKHYKNRSVDFVLELIDWAKITSEEILPKIIICLNRALEFSVVPGNKIQILWETLLEKLKENWRNTDLANYLLGCLVNMLIEYSNICNSKDLMDQMEYMYTESQEEDDDEIILILPPIFLDIWSNTDVEITHSLFHDFSNLIISEQVNDWSYPLILNYYNKIVNREPDPYIIKDAAYVLAHFILLDKEKMDEMEFQEDLIIKMKQSLNLCYKNCEQVKNLIIDEYKSSPKKTNLLNMIFDADSA